MNKSGSIEFHQLVVELVDVKKRDNGETLEDISKTLNLSESYIRKIHSAASTKRYNLVQLIILAQNWEISLIELLPIIENKDNLRKLEILSRYSDEELDNFLKEIYRSIVTESDLRDIN